MKLPFLLLIPLVAAISSQAQDSVGIFPFSQDIGKPAVKGSAQYDSDTQVYTVKGGGYDVWYNRDEFHYLWKKMTDNFTLTASFKLMGAGGNSQLKTGWMIRQETDPASAHISTAVHNNGLTVLQWRSQTGANMLFPQNELPSSKRNMQVMQLERQGDLFIMRAAQYGEPLQVVGYREMKNMTGEILAGLFVCAHDTNSIGEAKIWNVRIDKPVPTRAEPNRAWRIESRLETEDVFNGKRRIVYHTTGRIESPNWMPDDKKILFNMDGLLYTVPVSGGKTEVWNTGAANHINGTHCISMDGKMLAINNIEAGRLNILVIPMGGGQPKLVQNDVPAYLHGLSPDNKEVAFVAPSKTIPVYDVYRSLSTVERQSSSLTVRPMNSPTAANTHPMAIISIITPRKMGEPCRYGG